MNSRIRVTPREHGMTIADDRTGLRLEVHETLVGLIVETYGYHSRLEAPVVRLFEPGERGPHPEVHFVMPEPLAVPRKDR